MKFLRKIKAWDYKNKETIKKVSRPLWLGALMLLTWYALFGYKYQFIYNYGTSMEPTLSHKDWIVVQKKSDLPKNWEPDRYDIVIIEGPTEKLTKRVLALGGEFLEIKNGVVYVNDKPQTLFGEGKIGLYLVDEEDNHLRYWDGPEKGKPVIELTNQVRKKVPKNHVWVVGDNRMESWYGTLPIKNIKALVIF